MSNKTVTLNNSVDTWVNSNKAAKNYADGSMIQIQSGSAYGYVYFPRPFPLGATIVSAVLRFETKNTWGTGSVTLTAQRASSKYSVSKVNWNTKSGATGANASKTQTVTGDRAVWEINVANIMQQVSDGSAWYGFRITGNNSTRRALRSAQASVGKPQLIVTWSEAPDKPTTLNPSGGSVVSSSKPVLEADYTDTSGSTTLASIQVQIDAANDFNSGIDWDSGEQLATGKTATLDLNTTSYPGLTAGATTYWRVRVKDSAGLWSDWSTSTSFKRVTKPTATISNPSGATVADSSPPIIWSFSGTQESWRVYVKNISTGAVVWDSEQVGGTATSVQMPGGRNGVLRTGTSYRLHVQVWDTEDRVATSGDPTYSEATRDFTYVPGATTAPASLTAVAQSFPPAAVLTWTRSTAPDSFKVLERVDGKDRVLVADLDPADLLVSGTTYQYTLSRVRPNINNDIRVAAVVNDVSSPHTAVTVNVPFGGAWLEAIDGEQSLFIAGTGSSSLGMVEDAETLVPLGSDRAVRVTQGVRGWEGTISGILVEHAGKTLQEWVDQALRMRSRPGQTYTLSIGTESFDVVVGNMTVEPTGHRAPETRAVSFDFWQVSPGRYEVEL